MSPRGGCADCKTRSSGMSLPMMAAALTATTLGVALLTAPTQAQDPNASPATAPKARSDIAPATSAARRAATSAAPSSTTLGATGDAASTIKVPPSQGNSGDAAAAQGGARR
jgi:hypothetical protein